MTLHNTTLRLCLTKPFLLAFFLLAILSDPVISYANEITSLKEKAAELNTINEKLKTRKYDYSDLTKWTELTINIESASHLCVSKKTVALDTLDTTIKSLGEKNQNEASSITQSRQGLLNDRNELDKNIAECNVYALTVKETTDLLNAAKQYYLKDKYLSREPHIASVLYNLIVNPVALFTDSTEFLWKHSGIRDFNVLEWSITTLIVGFVLLASYRIRKFLLKIESTQEENDNLDNLFIRASLTTGARYLPWITGSFAASLILFYQTSHIEDTPFIAEVAYSLTLYFIAVAGVSLLLSPSPPAKPFLAIMGTTAAKLSRRLKILFMLSLIGNLAFYTIFSKSFPDSTLLLLRYVFTLAIVLNIIWTIRAVIKSPGLSNLRWLSRTITFILLLTVIIEWLGYINLSIAVRSGTIITFILLLASLVTAHVFRGIFNIMDESSRGWAKRIRKTIGADSRNKIPGLIWVRLTFSILLWSTFILITIRIWDVSGVVLPQVKDYVFNGFQIGDFRVVPEKIVWALLILTVFLTFAGWIKYQLEHKWLRATDMDNGARDAVTTIIGYIMFIIAVLATLSTAGFDFGNIAIIAGALSVGIGFGLQNIVNNFVSGLILLFERPIRKGDWIVVGNTEGYVQNIQIRSTLIRTFDQSDVIVPNSELISNQVTNWLLSSKHGRAVIPIGVAYGTNTEKVRDILMDIAKNNEKIIHNKPRMAPTVLFREFGDSSLNFELRIFLKEIDNRLSVISDINFSIEKAFREANISIPFPQRDVHVHTLPDKSDH